MDVKPPSSYSDWRAGWVWGEGGGPPDGHPFRCPSAQLSCSYPQRNSRPCWSGCQTTGSWTPQPSPSSGPWTPASSTATSSWESAWKCCSRRPIGSSAGSSTSASAVTGSPASACPRRGEHPRCPSQSTSPMTATEAGEGPCPTQQSWECWRTRGLLESPIILTYLRVTLSYELHLKWEREKKTERLILLLYKL